MMSVHLPSGGMQETGNGHREAGQAALDFTTGWEALYADYWGRLQRAQIDHVETPGVRSCKRTPLLNRKT